MSSRPRSNSSDLPAEDQQTDKKQRTDDGAAAAGALVLSTPTEAAPATAFSATAADSAIAASAPAAQPASDAAAAVAAAAVDTEPVTAASAECVSSVSASSSADPAESKSSAESCIVCSKTSDAPLLRCSKCKSAAVLCCGKECQRAHQKECKAIGLDGKPPRKGISFRALDEENGCSCIFLYQRNPDLSEIKDTDEIVIAESSIVIQLSYPLSDKFDFAVQADTPHGFTRGGLARAICKLYQQVYDAEAETGGEPPIIPGLLNRGTTHGMFGIWGHDLGDLVCHSVSYKPDQHLYTLGVDS